MERLVVYCTCPDEVVAERIAHALVAESLAACVNIVPGVTSIYRWRGEVQRDAELLLIIKTSDEVYAVLEQRIRTLHPYAIPEIIALPVGRGSSDYLAWLDASVGPVDKPSC